MTPLLEKLYKELITHIKANRDKFSESELCVFTPAKGKEYDGKFLFIGRSVNGWLEEYSIKKDNDADYDKVIEVINEVCKKYNNENVNNLAWVEEHWSGRKKYNTKKSAFWRLIIKILNHYYQKDISAVHKASWNNLYKISPSKGGNPSSPLKNLQLDLCRSILNLEIEEFNPRYVIFLTGMERWVQPFLNMEEFINLTDEFIGAQTDKIKFIKFIGVNKNSEKIYIVSQHPQRKPEDPHLKEIIEGLNFAKKELWKLLKNA